MGSFIKHIICFVIILIVSGCSASTVRYNSSLTLDPATPSKATIKVNRLDNRFAGSFSPIGIQDGTTKIGLLGPGGELVWNRDPGYAAIVAKGSIYTTHVIILPVEAGKTYLMKAGYTTDIWEFTPDNFSKELIVYELKAEPTRSIPDEFWKLELEKLSSQKK